MPEVAQATLAVTPVLQGAQQKITSELTNAANPAGMAAGTSVGKQIGSYAVKAVAALGVGKAIGDSISKGMNFETSMAKANTLFTGTSEEFAKLQSQILDISSATGMAASELAEAAYSAESASVPMGNLGSMIEASSKLAVSGFTDVDTALSATAKTMNAYGMMSDNVTETQANMDKVQKVLIQTQNKGITTVGELGASLANVTPTAAAANVSFEQVGAALALMTAQGTPTAQATTQLRSAIAELEKEGTKASEALKAAAEGTEYAGMSFVDMMDAGADLGDVMGMLQDYADKSGVSMLDLWSSIEGGNAAMAIAKDVEVFDDDLAAMATEADVVGDAYETMSDTVSHKMEEIKRSLENIGISAFAEVADDLLGVLDGASDILEDITPALGDLGGAFMDMAGSAVDSFAELWGIDENLSTTEKAAEILKTGIEGLSDIFKFASENMDTIVPVLGALAGAFVLTHGPIGGIVKGVEGLIGKIGSIGTEAATAAGPIATAGSSFAGMAGEAIKMLAAAAALYVAAQAMSVLVDSAIRITEAGWPAIAVLGGMVVAIGALMGVAALVGPALTAGAVGIIVFGASFLMITAGVALASAGITMVIGAVTELTDCILGHSEEINSIVTNVGETVDSTITTISDGITNVIDAISGGVSGVLDSLAGVFDSIGESALNAGTGFEKLADAVINLTNNTGVLDLAGTLGATAGGVKDITKAAGEAGKAATEVNQLGSSFKMLGLSATATTQTMTVFGTNTTTALNAVSNAFRSMNLAQSMQTAINGAISAASSGISRLRSMFASTHFSFSQHIAVPHFSMSGAFNAQTGSVPSIVTRWYAKAAEYGALFTKPQIIGVGDASQPEILLGEEKLKELVGGGTTINNYMTINGAEDPEAWGADFARSLKQYIRVTV